MKLDKKQIQVYLNRELRILPTLINEAIENGDGVSMGYFIMRQGQIKFELENIDQVIKGYVKG